MKKYKLNEVFTMAEVEERYGVNKFTVQNKLKPSTSDSKLEEWIKQGIIVKSGKTWLLTDDFMQLHNWSKINLK